MIRVHGDVRRINLPPMEHKDVHAMVYDIMNDGQRKIYEENLECDFSFAIPNLARFRVNAFVQNRGAGAVMRTIPSKVLSLEELKAPNIFKEISAIPARHRAGHRARRVPASRPRWRPWSTTSTRTSMGHILTVEDPIEFVHEIEEVPDQPARGRPAHAVVRQRPALARCAKIRTSSWSAKCAIWKPSAWR